MSIDRAAAQRDFYSKPSTEGLPTLDDLITDYEGRLSGIVRDVPALEVGDDIPAHQASEIVSHLAVRSSYLRGFVEDAANSLADTISHILHGVIDGKRISLPKHRVPPGLAEYTLNEFRQRGLMDQTNVSEQSVVKLVYFALREEGPEILQQSKSIIMELIAEMTSGSKKLGRSTQTKVLAEELAPVKRRETLEKLSWQVFQGPPEGAILPDCTSIAFDGTEWSSNIVASGHDAMVVVLPMTPDKLAVGRMNPKVDFDPSDFNRHAVSAAHTFFLSSKRHSELEGAMGSLGENVRQQLGKLTSKAAAESLDKWLSLDREAGEIQEDGGGHSWVAEGDLPTQVKVTLYDFGDDGFAKQVSDKVLSVLHAYAKVVPAVGIEDFIFANDFNAAIGSVDFGYESNASSTPFDDENNLGVALPLTVMREGKIQTIAVLRAGVAVWLISDKDDEIEDGQQVIVNLLAHASLTNLMRNKFPTQMLSAITDPYEDFLFGTMNRPGFAGDC